MYGNFGADSHDRVRVSPFRAAVPPRSRLEVVSTKPSHGNSTEAPLHFRKVNPLTFLCYKSPHPYRRTKPLTTLSTAAVRPLSLRPPDYGFLCHTRVPEVASKWSQPSRRTATRRRLRCSGFPSVSLHLKFLQHKPTKDETKWKQNSSVRDVGRSTNTV